jgi:hypothetical protein
MSAIGTLNPGNSGVASLPTTTRTAADDDSSADSSTLTTPTLVEGVKVSLSGAAIAKSSSTGGGNRADGRHAQADQVAVGLRAVALEVAVQPRPWRLAMASASSGSAKWSMPM